MLHTGKMYYKGWCEGGGGGVITENMSNWGVT